MLRCFRSYFIVLLAVFLCAVSVYSQDADRTLLITEFMASNNEFMADEDNEYPDWIELFNASNTAVNLSGWHLTDESNDLE